MPAQVAMLILAYCTAPRMDFLARVMPPRLLWPAAARFRDDIIDAVACILKLSMTDRAIKRLFLPIRYGGLGIRDTASIAVFAFVGSIALTAPSYTIHGSAREDYITSYHQCRQLVDDDALLTDDPMKAFRSFAANPCPKLQSALTREHYKRKHLALLSVMEPREKRLAKSMCEKGAGMFLRAIPSSLDLRMFDWSYCTAVRVRLLLPPIDLMPSSCTCGSDDLHSHPYHWLCCPKRRQKYDVKRHDLIKHALADFARQAGAVVTVEPRSSAGDDDRRTDIEALHPSPTLINVGITYPASQTNISRGRRRLVAAEHYARLGLKHNKFRKLAMAERAKFVPFIMESTGGLCNEGLQYLKYLAREISTRTGVDYARVMHSLRTTLSVRLQIGNALIFRHGLRSTRSAGIRH